MIQKGTSGTLKNPGAMLKCVNVGNRYYQFNRFFMPDSKATDSKAASKGGVVSVTIPASVAGNLATMQKITANVLGKLGCGQCHSGFDIRFNMEDLIFKADLRGEVTQGAIH